MYEEDERMRVEHADIEAKSITVNTGWTERMAFWNTVGTVAGALIALASLVLAYAISKRQDAFENRYIRESTNSTLKTWIKVPSGLPTLEKIMSKPCAEYERLVHPENQSFEK